MIEAHTRLANLEKAIGELSHRSAGAPYRHPHRRAL
jgi:hypothetical protein